MISHYKLFQNCDTPTPTHLDLVTGLHLLLLGNGVGDHHCLEGSVVDARDGRTREYAVCQDGIDFDGASADQPGR